MTITNSLWLVSGIYPCSLKTVWPPLEGSFFELEQEVLRYKLDIVGLNDVRSWDSGDYSSPSCYITFVLYCLVMINTNPMSGYWRLPWNVFSWPGIRFPTGFRLQDSEPSEGSSQLYSDMHQQRFPILGRRRRLTGNRRLMQSLFGSHLPSLVHDNLGRLPSSVGVRLLCKWH